MTRRQGRIFATVAMVALLGGCHHEQKATGHGTISGEILPGSVSDAMLPYDSVKSKAPLAPEESVQRPGSATTRNNGGTSGGDADKTAPAPAAAASAADSATPAVNASPTPPVAAAPL